MFTLTTSQSNAQQFTLPEPSTQEVVNLQFTVDDDSTDLPLNRIFVTLDWNNGSQVESYGPATSTLTVDSTKSLPSGKYFVKVSANNCRNPRPDTFIFYYTIEIFEPYSTAGRRGYLIGPILPKDSGSPGPLTWNFNTGRDLEVLASSVKMLLITQKGERLMNPSYGTRIRQFIFEHSTSTLGAQIEQEINFALAEFEPRVILTSFVLEKISSTAINVNAIMTSRQDNSSFNVVLPFSQT